METFTPLIKFRQADYWLANPARGWGQVVGWFTFIYTLWGWLLTTLLATALAGLVRK